MFLFFWDTEATVVTCQRARQSLVNQPQLGYIMTNALIVHLWLGNVNFRLQSRQRHWGTGSFRLGAVRRTRVWSDCSCNGMQEEQRYSWRDMEITWRGNPKTLLSELVANYYGHDAPPNRPIFFIIECVSVETIYFHIEMRSLTYGLPYLTLDLSSSCVKDTLGHTVMSCFSV